MDLLDIWKKNFKNYEKTKLRIFDIEIDITMIIVKLPYDKLERVIK